MSNAEDLIRQAAVEPDEERRWLHIRALQQQGDADVLAAARGAATLADPRLHGDLVLLAFDHRWDAETRELLAAAVERTRPTS